MKTFGCCGDMRLMKVGWQHASQSEQNARAPLPHRVFDTLLLRVELGSASILLAQASILPGCSDKRAPTTTGRTTQTRIEKFIVSASSFIRHSPFVIHHST
jgi:hypothetical protein